MVWNTWMYAENDRRRRRELQLTPLLRKTEAMDDTSMEILSKLPSQDHNRAANWRFKNRCEVDSSFRKHIAHPDTIMQPRFRTFSSVGIFLCIQRHTIKEWEGGTGLSQSQSLQGKTCWTRSIKSHDCLVVYLPSIAAHQTSLSGSGVFRIDMLRISFTNSRKELTIMSRTNQLPLLMKEVLDNITYYLLWSNLNQEESY
jgi:hypothetical protein